MPPPRLDKAEFDQWRQAPLHRPDAQPGALGDLLVSRPAVAVLVGALGQVQQDQLRARVQLVPPDRDLLPGPVAGLPAHRLLRPSAPVPWFMEPPGSRSMLLDPLLGFPALVADGPPVL